MWLVYLLKSEASKWYYVGSTNRLELRIKEHNTGKVRSTKHFIPLKCVWRKEFLTEQEARSYEKMLKDKRKAKEALIRSLES